jgi:hypothetical protein
MRIHSHDLPATVGVSGVVSAATKLLQVAALASRAPTRYRLAHSPVYSGTVSCSLAVPGR